MKILQLSQPEKMSLTFLLKTVIYHAIRIHLLMESSRGILCPPEMDSSVLINHKEAFFE